MEFGTMLARELEGLRGLARHITKNRADADDLVQDTAVRALVARDRGSYIETGAMRPWLICILYNQYKRLARDRARHPAESLDMLFEDFHPVSMPAGEWSVALADARKALDRITAEHASIIVLDAVGLSYDEIADRQSIKMGTVKSRLNRARACIREEVDGRVAA